ncbi:MULTISPECIES: class I SAM-dependent methyltransferase [unclassified Pseudoclavibacter]|uniref:class I SAM-dependent methyltransferase n=1 Tax=unclassified Pseudoclavibacter TaxID=2615177 RepID=UPI001BAB1AB6|nr:class I SAM-dependent methyltransferase [Pseudoclavibacter sp. Marseille-Q4354]MBS3179764.1 class I SAM-dependent methyltransferase [Pseudoclavibacter sp. Marseille-Q4354]
MTSHHHHASDASDPSAASGTNAAAAADQPQAPTEFWEQLYSAKPAVWSGRVNANLASVAGALTPGRALDLGCGEGGDAIWLAQQGWRVTGIDISTVAIDRARAAALTAGIDESLIDFVAGDLETWRPDEPLDLATASFFQSPVHLPRTQILREAALMLAPGGHLLTVAHAGPPSWVETSEHPAHLFVHPEREVADLALPADEWEAVVAELRTREVTSPDGEPGTLEDSVVLLRRRA